MPFLRATHLQQAALHLRGAAPFLTRRSVLQNQYLVRCVLSSRQRGFVTTHHRNPQLSRSGHCYQGFPLICQTHLAASLCGQQRRCSIVTATALGGVLNFCSGIAVIYGLALLAVFLLQRKLIFILPMHTVNPESQGGDPLLVMLPAVAGPEKYVAAYYKLQSRANAPVLVYFHGNADQLGFGPAFLGNYFQKQFHFGLYGIEYPGYGLSCPGSPSEDSIYAAAEALLLHLEVLGVHPSQVVLFGHSIGCAVAIEMAKRGFGSRLVLVSPFTSMLEISSTIYPFLVPALKVAPWLVRDPFDNRTKASSITIPTLVVHGAQDEIVPFWMGRELANLIRGASFLPVSGMDHNNVFNRDDILKEIATFSGSDAEKHARCP